MWKPMGDRVLVRKITQDDNVTASGITLVQSAENEWDNSAKAEVVAVGTGQQPDGTVRPMPVSEGDIIVYHKHYGTDLSGLLPTDADKDMMVLETDDILAIDTSG